VRPDGKFELVHRGREHLADAGKLGVLFRLLLRRLRFEVEVNEELDMIAQDLPAYAIASSGVIDPSVSISIVSFS